MNAKLISDRRAMLEPAQDVLTADRVRLIRRRSAQKIVEDCDFTFEIVNFCLSCYNFRILSLSLIVVLGNLAPNLHTSRLRSLLAVYTWQ